MKKSIRAALKVTALVALGLSQMGNKGCEEQVQAPLKRTVILSEVGSPPVAIPGFDFKYAAQTQLVDAVNRSGAFTLLKGNSVNPETLTSYDRELFYRCEQAPQGLMSKASVITRDAFCMVDAPHVKIDSNILNFQLTSGSSVSLDLDQWHLGLGLKFKSYSYTMNFYASHPYNVNEQHASIKALSKKNDFRGKLGFSFGGIGLGFDHYQSTELSKVVYSALSEGIQGLSTQMDANAKAREPYGDLSASWYAPVYRDCDNYLLIRAGGILGEGLREGDVLAIHNVAYKFEGEACVSKYQSSTPSELVGYATIVGSPGTEFSYAKFEMLPGAVDSIKPGARAYMFKRGEPKVVAKSKASQ